MTINIWCQNGTAAKMHLKKGTKQVHISSICHGTFLNHLITSDYLVQLDIKIFHNVWDWYPIQCLPYRDFIEMKEALKHIGELRLYHPDLADLQYIIQLESVRSSSASRSILAGTTSSMSGMASSPGPSSPSSLC
jgi:hypothetical protein